MGFDVSRQRREQYFTASQSRAHFLRQAKGRAQAAQSLVGRSDLRRCGAMASPWMPSIPVSRPCALVGADANRIGTASTARGDAVKQYGCSFPSVEGKDPQQESDRVTHATTGDVQPSR